MAMLTAPLSSTNTETVYRALRAFAEHMNRPVTPADGWLSARVIGEFSAGKTRLLRELLADTIPSPLFPVSSLERQTRLPLEITYGETPELTLIERAEDCDPLREPIRRFQTFPMREDLADYDPLQYRLRLAIPEPRLFLPTGDRCQEGDTPKRLLLIDLPGWNSGEDALAEQAATALLTGYYNLALVFVIDANRLDGSANEERLRDFLGALAEADFVGEPSLIVVITHCPPADQSRLTERMRARVRGLWADLDGASDGLVLHLMAVDFGALGADELAAFREEFWSHLLAPLKEETAPAHPWIAGARAWPADWDLRPRLPGAWAVLEEARTLLERACIEGEFLPGMNRHRLLGLDAAGIYDHVRGPWLRQLDCQTTERLTERLAAPPPLPEPHPLAGWWQQYWQANLERTLSPIRGFFQQADAALRAISPETQDVRAHLVERLTGPYREAVGALDSSFVCLVETAQALAAETQPERALATLLSLSLLEARYADHYERAKISLP
jgi:hypothetical protein